MTLETRRGENRRGIDVSREYLGGNILEGDALHKLERQIKEEGGTAFEFCMDLPTFPFSGEDMRLAGKYGEILVLRQHRITFPGSGYRVPLTLINFLDLFKDNKFGNIDLGDWREEAENFGILNDQVGLGWALVRKNPSNELGNTWVEHEAALRDYEKTLRREADPYYDFKGYVRRRTPAEVVFDSLVQHALTGEVPLSEAADITETPVPQIKGSFVTVSIVNNTLSFGRTFPGEHGTPAAAPYATR